MKNYEFFIDTEEKLREIFAEHCDLSPEQYLELKEQFIYLICDYQEAEPLEEIVGRVNYLRAVSELLYNTKELTLKEKYELDDLIETIVEEGAAYGQA